MTTFSVKNYSKRNTPRRLVYIADAGLVIGVFVQSQVPLMPIPETHKYWVGFGVALLVTAFKFLTKMFGIPEPPQDIEEEPQGI